ncbi:hypothetical protein GGR39_001689 [Novosphingobium fluoreni]|uniref:Uncharacterized protein n=1 Tax=Novosphingobium fluoreni TaxID=1391222 RepID=A0A7W6BY08_9SPHN|nr:hypothetical protein [Novosphingobium fluoreni]MBB3940039.1 hypothetical protein [Novosphingobium fluoreni]
MAAALVPKVEARVDPAVDRAVVAVVKALAVDQGGMLVAPDVIVAARRRPSGAAPSAVVLSEERNAEAQTGMDHAAAPVVRPMIVPVAGLIAVLSGPIAMGRDGAAAQSAGRNFGETLMAERQGLTHGAAARGPTALDVSPCRKTGARAW